MTGVKTAILAAVVIVALLVGALVVAEVVAGMQQSRCEELDAVRKPAGHGHFLCVAPDGRVVGP